jgi:small subunit ribosomal protein S17
MDKTVVVAVTRLFQHPKYKKTVKRVTKFKAHDENNKYQVGDTVKIIETRPLSKEKRWIVIE